MQLQYLDFEPSEDTDGRGTFDAMASVPAARLPALQAEVAAVLGWAHGAFGAPGPLDAGAEWDVALHGTQEVETPLEVAYDAQRGTLALRPHGAPGAPRTTLSLTLVGTPAFCEAFRAAFAPAD